jgi:hypothetical protein
MAACDEVLRLSFSSTERTAAANGTEPVVEDLVGPAGDSETSSTIPGGGASKKLAQSPPVQPKALFPWRHETADNPLPRLTRDAPEFKYNTSAAVPRGTQSFIANMFLQIPTWQTLLVDWRAQLAESASYAFTRGVAGIISNVYRVPYRRLLRDDASADTTTLTFFDSNLGDGEASATAAGNATDVPPPPNDNPSSSSSTERNEENPADEDEDEDDCPDVECMLDQPLRKLFQSAHEHGKDQLLVRLETTPIRAVFYSLFCLPFVSRRAAARDPSVLEQMKKVVLRASRQTDVSAGFSAMYEYVQSQVEQHDRLETTVELQVLVECEEIFQVVDRSTGIVVQGAGAGGAGSPGDGESSDGQPPSPSKRVVWHLVSLEATSTTNFSDTFPYLPETIPGNWVITDIDDLLSVRKWYHTT